MTYGKAYLEGWKDIFNYEGVSNRFEFRPFMIGNGVIYLSPLLRWWLTVTINSDYDVLIFFVLLAPPILTLILTIPTIALAVRRMHDIGYSGWWATIVALIPITGVILFILCCLSLKSQSQA